VHEAVFTRARIQRQAQASSAAATLYCLARAHAENAAHRNWSLALVQGLAQRGPNHPADVPGFQRLSRYPAAVSRRVRVA